jgi:DNA-binding PadR family transcriptional regulator
MIIDTENLNTLTLHEVAALLLLYDKRVEKSKLVVEVRDTDFERLLNSLEKKGFIVSSIYATDNNIKPPFQHVCYSLLEAGRQELANNCVSNRSIIKTANKESIKKKCDALAPKLMEIYPAGKKPGTSNQWRGYTSGVSEKLQKILLSGNSFTDEEAIEATKAYIAGFNGMYTNMRTLPYFLGKNEIVGGEVKKTCDFMSYVEDLRSNTENHHISRDWEVELR